MNSESPVDKQRRLIADAWRILGGLGLVDTIFNHISSTIDNGTGGLTLLLNPDGRLPHEVRAQDLCACALRPYEAHEAAAIGASADGLRLHSLIQHLRGRSGTVIHTHALYSIAVGCSEHGLLPLSQTALEFYGDVEVFDYNGLFRGEGPTAPMRRIASDGGVGLLRNHGALVVADSVEEAVYLAFYVEEACRIQVTTLSQGVRYQLPTAAVISDAHATLRADRLQAATKLFEAFRRRFTA
jgi:ribulose-5-phosphate 4-epimerase/fuculose-1-phosphate aldolase